jgi:hypothetical protein
MPQPPHVDRARAGGGVSPNSDAALGTSPMTFGKRFELIGITLNHVVIVWIKRSIAHSNDRPIPLYDR